MLVIEDVEDTGEVICVRARTRDGAVTCPGCGAETARVHEYRERTAADVPVGGRRVLVRVRVRRMRCPALGLPAYRAAGPPEDPLPEVTVPRVLGIDDFALRRGSVYATVLIDAQTGCRVDVVPGRTAGAAGEWLRNHPGVEIVCRDGSGAYGEAVRQALPSAVQVGDRWHLWHGLGEAVRKEVAGHSACWAKGRGRGLIIPSAIDQGTSPADQAKPVKIVRPAGRCILTGLAWPAPWRAGRRQTN